MAYVIVILLVLILDQGFKYWVILNIVPNTSIPFIPGFMALNHVHNTGAAFGFFQDGRWYFVALTIAFIVIAIVLIAKDVIKGRFGKWSLVLVIAGALGNFIDRLFKGYVIDMFQFEFVNFAIFNIADIFIVLAGIAFCFHIIFYRERVPSKIEEDKPYRPIPEASGRPQREVSQVQKSKAAPTPSDSDPFYELTHGISSSSPWAGASPSSASSFSSGRATAIPPGPDRRPVQPVKKRGEGEYSLEEILIEFNVND